MRQSVKAYLLAGCLALTWPGIAAAQTPPAQPAPLPPPEAENVDPTSLAPAAADEPEMMIVTGSRISRPEIEFANPVQTFSAATIQQSGRTNLTDLLVDSPALVGSITSADNSGSNTLGGGTGVNLLDLRNLGTERTLVLVNGRRHVNAFPGENSVDINTIPTDLVQRVDVLTGGVSAIYGADGVSGVVNFIMRRDFEGMIARAQSGISQSGDAGNRFASILVGKNFNDKRGNIAVAFEYSNTDQLNERQRPFTGNSAKRFEMRRNPADPDDDPALPDFVPRNNVSWADSARNAAVDITLDGVPEFDGDGRPYDRGELLDSTYATNSGSNTPTAGYFGDIFPFTELYNTNVLLSYEVSPAFRVFAEGKYVHTNARTAIQPSFDLFTYLTPENPFLIERFGDAAPDGALFNRDNFDLGVGTQTASRNTYRAVIGFDGVLSQGKGSGNFRYDVGYVYGRADSTVTDTNQRLVDRYYAGLDAVVDPDTGQTTCRINLPGETIIDPNNYADLATIGGVPVTGAPLSFKPGECVPINILGTGVTSAEGKAFAFVDNTTTGRSTQNVVTANFSGDLGFAFTLPGGPIGFSIGAEYREESTSSTTSAFQSGGFFDGGAPVQSSGGSFDVKEIYGELNIPLLNDVPWAENLSFGGAVRYSDYSTVGTATTWMVNGTWTPVKDITLRATLSSAVRAPNVTELFSPLQGTFRSLDDPCDPLFLAEGTEFRAANCQATLTNAGLSAVDIANFSPSTDPEWGGVLQPGLEGGNPDLGAETADTWTAGIVLRPRFIPGLTITADWYDINISNAINTPDVNEVFKLCVDAESLDNVFCNSFERTPGTGFIRNFVVTSQNVAAFTTSGLDFTINYNFSPSPKWGNFNFRLVGGYLNDLSFTAAIGGLPEQQRNRIYRPTYVGLMDLTWNINNLTLNYGLSWQGKTQRFTTIQIEANPDISDPQYFMYKERWEHDIQANYQVNDVFSFYGGINNFTNQQPDFATPFGYPVSARGRYFYFGARVQLPTLF